MIKFIRNPILNSHPALRKQSLYQRLMGWLHADSTLRSERTVDESYNSLRRADAYQFPKTNIEDFKEELPTPQTLKQEKEQFVFNQAEITDLERLRMLKLDQKIGTNTHFHEIERHEERLDSEHVMSRKMMIREEIKKEKQLQHQSLFKRDPQERIELPAIRNRADFKKQLNKLIKTPKHEKRPFNYKLGDKLIHDNYSYLAINLQEESSDLDYPLKKQQTLEFLTKEQIHSTKQLFEMQYLITILRQDYIKRAEVFHQAPLLYENHKYYQQDPKQGFPQYNLYRDNDELVFSGQDLVAILEAYQERIYEDLIEDIQTGEAASFYDSLFFNFDHSIICIDIELPLKLSSEQSRPHIHVVKSKDNHILLENVGSSCAFLKTLENEYLLYIETSEFGMQKNVSALELWSGHKKVVCNLKTNSQAELIGINKDCAIMLVQDANENENEVFVLTQNSFKQIKKKEKNVIWLVDYNFSSIFLANNLGNLEQIQISDFNKVVKYYEPQMVGFNSFNHFLAIIFKDSLKVYNFITKKDHEYKFLEPQLNLQMEYNHDKSQSQLIVQRISPYTPFQLLSYNMNMKTVEIHFQKQIAGLKEVQYETLKIDQLNQITVFYYRDRISTHSTAIFLISDGFDPLSFENVSLLEKGFILSVVNINDYTNSQECSKVLIEACQKLKDFHLCSKVALYGIAMVLIIIQIAKGPRQGYVGLWTFIKNSQEFSCIVSHVSIFIINYLLRMEFTIIIGQCIREVKKLIGQWKKIHRRIKYHLQIMYLFLVNSNKLVKVVKQQLYQEKTVKQTIQNIRMTAIVQKFLQNMLRIQ